MRHQNSFLLILFLLCLAVAPVRAEDRAESDLPARQVYHHENHVVEQDGKMVSTYRLATKVIKSQAVEDAKQTTLNISRSAQALKVLEAYTLKPNGKHLQVPKSSWQVTQATGRSGSSPIFSDYSSTTLVFPDVAVGDTVVVAYQISTREPLFPGKVSLAGSFPKAYAYDDVRIVVDAPVAMALKTKTFGMSETVATKGARKTTTWIYQNKTPTVEKRRNWSVFDVGTHPGFLLSSFDDWNDVARSYVQRASPKAAVTPEIRELATQLAGDKPDVQQKVKAVHEWVATKVDYAGNCVGIGAVVPRDLSVVLKHRIGDCKDHATLVQALLAALQIESHQVLVNAGSLYRLPEVPVASMVNHVINYVPALNLFLDATDSLTPLGRLPFQLYGKPVLTADAKVPTKIPGEPGGNTQTMTTKIQISDDGSATGSVEVELGGLYAISARGGFKNFSAEQRTRYVRDAFRAQGLEAEGQFEHDDPLPMLDRFHYKATFKIKRAVRYPGAGAMSVGPWFYNEAPVGHWAQNAVEPDEDLAFDAVCGSGTTTEDYEITWPAALQVLAIPQGTVVNTTLLNYESRYEMKGQVLTAHRALQDLNPSIICPPDTQRAFKTATEGILTDLKQQFLYR
jgi:transglutaminase-like putative cysteine protease